MQYELIYITNEAGGRVGYNQHISSPRGMPVLLNSLLRLWWLDIYSTRFFQLFNDIFNGADISV